MIKVRKKNLCRATGHGSFTQVVSVRGRVVVIIDEVSGMDDVVCADIVVEVLGVVVEVLDVNRLFDRVKLGDSS